MQRAYHLLLWMSLLSSLGCGTSTWTATEPATLPYQDVWEIVYIVASRYYDIDEASRKTGSLQTQWRLNLSIFAYEGYRQKASFQVEKKIGETTEAITEEPQSEEKGTQYVVKIRVVREENRDMIQPQISSEAAWLPKGFDSDEENRLKHFIEARLKYGMPGKLPAHP